MSTLRSRFNHLRQALHWSWADIDRITGRKQSRTNISKRVPAWAHLAIVAHESYRRLLERQIADAVHQRLGPDTWTVHYTTNGDTFFINSAPDAPSPVPWANLAFTPTTFTINAPAAVLQQLAPLLPPLYSPTPPVAADEGFTITVPIPLNPSNSKGLVSE